MNQAAKLSKLRQLAEALRAAILSARADFPRYLRRKFAAFPKSCCGHASILLALYLRENGFTDVQYVYNGSRGLKIDDSHAWLEVDGIVVDITADQFPDNANTVIVTEDHSWHSRFYGQQRSSNPLELYGEPENYRQAYDTVQKVLRQQ